MRSTGLVKTYYTEKEKLIVYDFWTNPNQTLADIGKKHSVTPIVVSSLISSFLKLNEQGRQEILNQVNNNEEDNG